MPKNCVPVSGGSDNAVTAAIAHDGQAIVEVMSAAGFCLTASAERI